MLELGDHIFQPQGVYEGSYGFRTYAAAIAALRFSFFPFHLSSEEEGHWLPPITPWVRTGGICNLSFSFVLVKSTELSVRCWT